MAEENGKNPQNMTNDPSKIFEKPIKEMSINTIKEKYLRNELKIEDILNNNECINDLKTNPNSKYKKILSLSNIHKLIDFCIYPSKSKVEISYITLRYPYYSCEALCSPCILLFRKSIKDIIEAETLENKLKKGDNTEKKGSEENDLNNSYNETSGEDSQTYFDYSQYKQFQTQNDSNSSNTISYFDYYNNDFSQELNDLQRIETEIQKDTMETAKKNDFNEEEQKTINDILDKIFGFLDLKFYLDETYVGYFQKIVNFLLLNEPRITIHYLFDQNNLVIKKFFRHLGNASIENILENILNYISDEENAQNNYNDNISESKFNMIIIELLDEIGSKINKEYDINNKKDVKNYYEDKNQIEFICEIIINTLINNTEKHFIELILLPRSPFLNRIIFLIKKVVRLEISDNYLNNKKTLLINLLEILLQINTLIMNSKNIQRQYKDDMTFFINPYRKIRLFESQYFCKKKINFETIYKAFEENRDSYISSIKNIYDLIKEDILQNFYSESPKEKGLTLKVLQEWKYILSSIKIFIFQFYSIENFEIHDYNEDFYDKRLFDLSLKLYNEYPKNNIYQNIFVGMIKILNFEKTPNYLINHFFNNKENIIDNIIENIKKTIASKDKFNLLYGPSIQILLTFFNSQNPACLQFFNDINNNTNIILFKKKFENLIKPRFNREFKDIYEFTEDEIFSDLNDSLDTFDGNDSESISKIKFESLKSIIHNFLDKLNFDNNFILNMSSNQNVNQKENNSNDSSQNSQKQITSYPINNSNNYIIKSEQTIGQSPNISENPSICLQTKFSIDEK